MGKLLDAVMRRPGRTAAVVAAIPVGVFSWFWVYGRGAWSPEDRMREPLPGDEDGWRQEVLDAAVQLEKQMLQQRLDELQAKQRNIGLDEADKYELRTLLQARIGRH